MQFYHRNKRDTWGNKRMRVDQKRLGGGGSTKGEMAEGYGGFNRLDFDKKARILFYSAFY